MLSSRSVLDWPIGEQQILLHLARGNFILVGVHALERKASLARSSVRGGVSVEFLIWNRAIFSSFADN